MDSTPRAYRLKASNAYLTFSTAVGTSPDRLAPLDGAISENTFSGDAKPKLMNELAGGLANADDFPGSFSGAFFGPSAAETGGVFDYESKENKNGAFRGSFGVSK